MAKIRDSCFFFTKITAATWFINKIIPVSIALLVLFCGGTLVEFDLGLLAVLFFAIVDGTSSSELD